ncbi:MAG: diaminopimelate decarboxylase [Pseudomonadota bacterium]|nr:diaminopimelate decarboxylase [Pseudomonadota bacterium]
MKDTTPERTSHIDGIPVKEIAESFGTPSIVYSYNKIYENFNAIKQSFESEKRKIFYSVKANSNLSILKIFNDLGAGFDIVSLGELKRVLSVNVDPKNIVYSGVGKSSNEILECMKINIRSFNVESIAELERIIKLSNEHKCLTRVSIRVNPNIDADTHEYISTGVEDSKFGISLSDIKDAVNLTQNNSFVELIGIDYHIGSQILDIKPFLKAIESVAQLYNELCDLGLNINLINMGGGLGINYTDESPPSLEEFGKEITSKIKECNLENLEFIIELGRSLIGNTGILITKVEYVKKGDQKNFLIVDAGMDNLIRPCLYNSKHKILNSSSSKDNGLKYDIVGPVCECSDFLGKDVKISAKQDDLICIYGCGAYVSSMSSNYNSRLKAAEIIIINDKCKEIRKRDTYEQLTENEILI